MPPDRDHGAASRFEMLLKVSEAANSHLDLADMLEALAATVREVAPVDGIAVATIGADGIMMPYSVHVVGMARHAGETVQQVVERALADWSVDDPHLTAGRPIDGSVAALVRSTRRAYLCRDVETHRDFADYEAMAASGARSFVCVPLFARDRFLGVILFFRRDDPPFDEEAANRLEEISTPVAMAVANALAYEEILRLRDRLAQENVALREEVDTRGMFEEIVGRSAALRKVLERVQLVAGTDATVLILGETGTGKELIARAIHRRSTRAAGPLVSVNCAALPNSLISSELFGHERGAFTGAVQRRVGRFELATDGSIFLDVIGDVPADIQVSLLRVLQEGEFDRVGGARPVRTNARVIAATHRDLTAAVAAGTFRSDLFFRINVFPIELPPLRERAEDIPLLVEYFALRHGARVGKRFRSLEAGSLQRLRAYPWPGNVRELENVIERAVILSSGDRLRIDQQSLKGGGAPGGGLPVSTAAGLRRGLRETEKRLIEEALAACRGRVSGDSGAAVRLGLPASTLERKIRQHGIAKYRYRSP
ncbi:MAG: sigma 54-interacting transcriptional regulator [Candidatus Krumholzibacteriia bacterium]